ncbi:MAG: FAD-binding oxidoreductase [Gammaproteobacteria bacterium]
MIEALRAALPRGELMTDTATRVTYGYDNSRRRALPDAVAFPADAEEVAALVAACHAAQIPVVARGMGTATTGAAVPVDGGLVVAFERMNRILSVNPDDRLLVCQPGALNSEVQAAAGAAGFFWAPDPTSAAYSTVGGNIACNAAGPRAVKYGATRENVLGLAAVTGTGAPFRTGTRTTKASIGYDLTRLIVGSEGTLALVTEATLKLTPLPAATATLQATYDGVDAAARAVAAVMAGPITPSKLEFMDAAALALVRDHAGAKLPVGAGAMLLIECDGDAERAVADLDAVAARARVTGCIALERATTEEETRQLWQCRRALSPAQRKLKPHKINEDVAVPVSQLPALVNGVAALAAAHQLVVVSFGHAGNGNLHVNVLGDAEDSAELARMHACVSDLFDVVLRLGGTLSGEHGIGYDKRAFITREVDPVAIELMRAIKRQFDPAGILNPNKLFPANAD